MKNQHFAIYKDPITGDVYTLEYDERDKDQVWDDPDLVGLVDATSCAAAEQIFNKGE